MGRTASMIIMAVIAAGAGYFVGKNTSSTTDETEEIVGDVGTEGGDEAGEAAPADGIERYALPVSDKQPSKGPDDALVTIVEFSEFQCPFCKRVLPTTEQIEEEYGDKVRFIWRNNPLPFHKDADPAAQLAMEAFEQGGNEKFWEVHDALFENQQSLGREQLEQYAKDAGLNMDEVKAALDNKEHAGVIKADQEIAARFGARGTPGFFINGRSLRGAQPFDAFKTIIDDEIKRAQKLVDSGTDKDELYATITKDALNKAAPPKPEVRPGSPDASATYKVPLTGKEPARGGKEPLVTIVEFSDFQCPFCSRVEPTINGLLEKYGDDLRVVWMNNPLPFHKDAKPAATLALEAMEQKGNEGFWKVHELIFANQRALTRADLEKYAKEAGLDVAKFKKALDTDKFAGVIKQQQELANSLGARGTPAFFINGRNLSGAQPAPAFESIIDAELKEAKALVDAGTKRADVYTKVIENGKTKVEAAPAAAAPDANKVYEIAVPKNAPSKGPANAKVVIQEFSDFQCPFCSRVLPTLSQIEKEYGDKVRIVWRNYPLPFHKEAHPAAQAALEVFRQGGNKKFWAFHDKLFENQRSLTRPDLEKYASEIGGINMKQFKAALDEGSHKAAVDADMAAVDKAGARIGTPSFFINGKLVQGAQPFQAFKTAIDEALAAAK